MNTENLITKGVKKHFNGQVVLFAVASLMEHFDGLQIHTSDIVEIENWEGDELLGTEEYIKASDVNFDGAVAKEVTAEEVSPAVEEKTQDEPKIGMTYEEAEKLMSIGELIALPEWGGFWFKGIRTDEVLVLTKDGEITNTPWEECKERNDWTVVEATAEQIQLLTDYWASIESPIVQITAEDIDSTLIDNPGFVDEGVSVGEITTVDAVEVKAEPITVEVAPKVVEKVAKTPKGKK